MHEPLNECELCRARFYVRVVGYGGAALVFRCPVCGQMSRPVPERVADSARKPAYAEWPVSIEQLVRDLLTLALEEELVDESEAWDFPDPQRRWPSDLTKLANLVSDWLALRDRHAPPPAAERREDFERIVVSTPAGDRVLRFDRAGTFCGVEPF